MTLNGHGRSLEQPGEAALHGVVLHAVAELARVGHARGGIGRERKVEAGIDERRVLRERHAIDGETDAGGGKGKCRVRRHVVEGVLPGARDMRRHQHAFPMHGLGSTQANRGVADVLVGAVAGERGKIATALMEVVAVDGDVSQPPKPHIAVG